MARMNTTHSIHPFFIHLFFIAAFSVLSSAATVATTYETGEELLAAVNVRMKEMHHATFTQDELTVWLATQADLNRSDGELQPKVASFLECLASKKKFKHPVGLRGFSRDALALTEDTDSKGRLALPDHHVLQVVIYHVRPGSKDAEGKSLKVTWSTIHLATALATPGGGQK